MVVIVVVITVVVVVVVVVFVIVGPDDQITSHRLANVSSVARRCCIKERSERHLDCPADRC